MPAGPTRKARRLTLYAPAEPVELTPDDLATLGRAARQVARRMPDHRVVDEDDLYQQGALALVAMRLRDPSASPELASTAARRAMHRLAFGKRLDWQATDALAAAKAAASAKRPAPEPCVAIDLRAAVASLPRGEAEVMGRKLRLSQERSEIASAVGMSPRWVGKRTLAGIGMLRIALADYQDEFARDATTRPAVRRGRARDATARLATASRAGEAEARAAAKLSIVAAARSRRP